ncbi:MAG: hypothetical protein ACREUU_12320, partial [Gammaproteobacteria bacterium]
FTQDNFQQRMHWAYRRIYRSGARVDHKLTDKDSFFARLTYTQLYRNEWDGNLPANGHRAGGWPQKAATVSYTRVILSDLLNEFRYGHTYVNNVHFNSKWHGKRVVEELGLRGLAPDLPEAAGLPRFGFSGITMTRIGVGGQVGSPGVTTIMHEFQDHASYFRGKHNFKAGFNLRHYKSPALRQPDPLYGDLTFSSLYTGHPYADFLLGTPDSASRSFPAVLQDTQRFIGSLFVTDNWKVNRRLTLDVGLRWDYLPPNSEIEGRLAIFDVTRGAVVVPDASIGKLSALVPASYVQFVKASDAGLPQSLIRSDKNDFGPRFGFAFRPFGNNATVIRGGYGIYYNAIGFGTIAAGGSPYLLAEPRFTNTTPVPTLLLPQVYPAGGPGQGLTSISLPSARNPNYRNPYTQQLSFTIEREMLNMSLRASYVGTLGRQSQYSRNYNAPPVDDRLFLDKPRPFPQYPAITYIDNGGNYNYHGLNVEAKRRMSDGLFYLVGWTWSRDIGDIRADNSGSGIENPFDRRRDRGPNQASTTHRLNIAAVYDLPVGRGKKLLGSAPRGVDLVTGGWQLSVVAYLQTGQYITPFLRMADPTGTEFTTSRNRPQVTIRPDYLRNAKLDNPTIDRWFDPTVFAAPPIGHFGNGGTGVIIGPGENLWNLGVYKYFRFADNERIPKVRIGMQATNIFNHPNYAFPETRLDLVQSVARIRSVGGVNGGVAGEALGMREIELSLRIEW